MTGSDSLYNLIKSLTQSEKRFFKINAAQHIIKGKNNYVILFEIIDKSKAYDDKKIKKQFLEKSSTHNYPETKYYLYNFILKTLNSYHSGSLINSTLKDLLQNVETLILKGLFSDAFKALNKAKKIATQYQKFTSLIEVLQWENILHDIDSVNHDTAKKGESTFNEISSIAETLQRESKLTYHYLLLQELHKPASVLYKKFYGAKKLNLKNYLNKIITYAQSINDTETLTNKIRAHYNISSAYIMLEQYNKAYPHLKKTIELFNQIKEFDTYLLIYYTEVSIRYMRITYIHFPELIRDAYLQNKKIKSVIHEYSKILPNIIKGFFLLRCNSIDYDLHMYMGKFGDTRFYNFEKTEKLITEYAGLFPDKRRFIFYINHAVSHFVYGNYNKALEWFSKAYNLKIENFRMDIQIDLRLYLLILHYELKNNFYLESLVKSTCRFLAKRKGLSEYEKTILDFLKITSHKNLSKPQLQKEFLTLKDKLNKTSSTSPHVNIDIILWLRSKIENKSLIDFLKEMYPSKDI